MKLTLKATQNQIPKENAKICLWKIILWTSLYLSEEYFILFFFTEGYIIFKNPDQIPCNITFKLSGFKYHSPHLQHSKLLLVCILHMSLKVK